MRFLVMVKCPEDAGTPPRELIEAIGKMSGEATQSGKMISTGGLAPTAASSKVRISCGRLSVIDGPFTETKEVAGGYAIMEFASKAEAIENAREFMELHRKFWPGWYGETEIRQMLGPEDFAVDGETFCVKPEALAKK